MISKKNIVSTQYSDHYLLDGVFDIPIGKIHIGSLNLLIRKALRLYQLQPNDHVLVRLNSPLKWVLNAPAFPIIEKNLEQMGKKLVCFSATHHDHEYVKKQLELIDISTNTLTTTLPPINKFYLEEEDTFYQRIYALGTLVGKSMSTSIKKNELNLFAIQELQTDDPTFSFFVDGLKSNKRDYLYCYCEKSHPLYSPAIIYDTRQFEQVDLKSDTSNHKRMESFKQSLISLIARTETPQDIGQLLVAAFKIKDSDETILFASVHIKFALINQSAHPSQVLMKEIAELAFQHQIIIAGDFNQKIKNLNEVAKIEDYLASADYHVKFKPTKLGLQLHNTLDALFVPSVSNKKSKSELQRILDF